MIRLSTRASHSIAQNAGKMIEAIKVKGIRTAPVNAA
jgi:hypothetical protein